MSEDRKFDINWPHGHETMSGTPARIIARDLRGDYPLVVVLEEEYGDDVQTYLNNGQYAFGEPASSLNLRNRPAP